MANVQPSVHSDSAQPGRPATSHRLVVAHTRWRAPASGQIARSYRQVVHTRRTLTHWRASPLTHARHATSPISARSAHDSPSDSRDYVGQPREPLCATHAVGSRPARAQPAHSVLAAPLDKTSRNRCRPQARSRAAPCLSTPHLAPHLAPRALASSARLASPLTPTCLSNASQPPAALWPPHAARSAR